MMPIQLPLLHIDRAHKTALVKNTKTGKSFPVIMQDWLADNVMLGDDAIVVKSLSGEWIMIDYKIETMTNKELDEFYQSLNDEEIMGTVDEEPQYQAVLEDYL